jgi:ribonuclease HI
MFLTVNFDGACAPINPFGHTTCGFVIKEYGKIIHEGSRYIGYGNGMSNNVAEYCGLIDAMGLLILDNVNHEDILFMGDSRLVIMQMNDLWGARGGMYYEYYKIAKELQQEFSSCVFQWIPREKNEYADMLSNRDMPDKYKYFKFK